MEEKRKYIRIKPSEPIMVKFKIISDKKRKRILKKGKTCPKNISGGGMFVELPLMKSNVINNLLSGKNKIALELKVPGRIPKIEILARVVWVDKTEGLRRKIHGIGVHFEEISEEDRERLIQHMLNLTLR